MATGKITPFLWFEKEAGEAARFYAGIFPDSTINGQADYDDTPSGEVQIYSVNLAGQQFSLMNAGPHHKFNEAISFVIDCEDQAEVDYYWTKLTADGGNESMCGWLKDKYGVSWQVVPRQLGELLGQDKSGRVMAAMLKMKKIVVADLEAAMEG